MAFEGYGKVEIFWIVPHLNRKRYYSIAVEPGLFGPLLVRSWGRMGEGRLRRKEHFFPESKLTEALDCANRLLTKKLNKGYLLTVGTPLKDPGLSIVDEHQLLSSKNKVNSAISCSRGDSAY